MYFVKQVAIKLYLNDIDNRLYIMVKTIHMQLFVNVDVC